MQARSVARKSGQLGRKVNVGSQARKQASGTDRKGQARRQAGQSWQEFKGR